MDWKSNTIYRAVPEILDVFGFSDLLDQGTLGALTPQGIANIKAATGYFRD